MKQKELPEKLTLVFEPDKVPIRVDTGANILEAARLNTSVQRISKKVGDKPARRLSFRTAR
jgi:hypothetical protein